MIRSLKIDKRRRFANTKQPRQQALKTLRVGYRREDIANEKRAKPSGISAIFLEDSPSSKIGGYYDRRSGQS